MASAKTVIWLIIWVIVLGIVSSQIQQKRGPPSFEYTGICTNIVCNSIETLMKLRNCTVVLGYLKIVVMEKTTTDDFVNISFPELREVTGYIIIYRVMGLVSLGQLLPNLVRIRGSELVYNFALIIFDMPDLLEIGLYSLLKIDRGNVIIWGGLLTCYMDTIRWELITNGRHMVFPPNTVPKCNVVCSCSLISAANFCWNNKKCQRLLQGPEAEICDDQCFGCKKRNPTECTLCRNYTHRNRCVSKCPDGTIVLPVNKYCVTEQECNKLGGWSWNNSCVFECPQKYIEWKSNTGMTCKRCDTCKQTCGSLRIHTLANIQSAENCVYVNGSLTIAIGSILPEALDEMRYYLSNIQEVTDYVFIHSSISISSLDFLSSLQKIRGQKLLDGKYSFAVSKMKNLQTLFTPNVTHNLTVDNGSLTFYDNPMLCLRHIKKLITKFPQRPDELDIPETSNGYSGGCDEAFLQLRIEVKNETSAVVIFNQSPDSKVHYFILYVRIPQGSRHATFVPETCSESEWNAISVPDLHLVNHTVRVEISSLRPASSYALCIETSEFYLNRIHLARSSIVNFNTLVGKPEPPFVIELVGSSSDKIFIRWVDHIDYRPHIHHYELDVRIIEITSNDIAARDHCIPVAEDPQELDYSRHVVVMRPPKNYERGCESMCGILSTVSVSAITEEYFDIFSSLGPGCDSDKHLTRPNNESFGPYVKTLALNLSSPRNDFEVKNLAPFRDYRLQLRACTVKDCSRYTNGVVRTLRSENADVPHIVSVVANASGDISVLWRPPKEINGVVLAYNIEVLPIVPDMENLLPRVYCVAANTTEFLGKYDLAQKYAVRVCSTTLGSNNICSSFRNVVIPSQDRRDDLPTWWWTGFPFAIIFYIGTLFIGWLTKTDRRSDEIHLIDTFISHANESDPPCELNSNVPLYFIETRN